MLYSSHRHFHSNPHRENPDNNTNQRISAEEQPLLRLNQAKIFECERGKCGVSATKTDYKE